MERKTRINKYTNKQIRILSFFAAFLLHSFLLIILFFDYRKGKTIKVIEITNISIISEKEMAESGKKTSLATSKSLLNKDAKKEVLAKDLVSNSDLLNGNSKSSEGAVLLYNPLPKIPDELRHEAFQSEALARFYISALGEVTNVELLKPCANPKLNYLLLKALRNWKFAPKDSPSTKDIKVNFKVE